MGECIYCKQTKPDDEFTLEHVIPQFLGGAQAPDYLKTRNVCDVCNNNLGLFVDAAFEKDFLVYNELHESAYALFNPNKPVGLPLRCMGNADLSPPNMKDDEVCECWLGPLGEQIYWIRPKDERMYWYSGGNPRTVKKVKSSAYFMFSVRSQKNPLLTWLSFRDAFATRRVKKILCGQVDGSDPQAIGFSIPDEVDNLRIKYFNEQCGDGQQRNNQLSMYIRYDLRFMAKLALGISHVMFGLNDSDYTKELRKALWFKEGDVEPDIKGTGALSSKDNHLKQHCGIPYGTTVAIIPTSEGVVVNLNLNQKMNWTVLCAKRKDLTNEQILGLGEGICVVLFKTLNKGVKLSLLELIAHNLGNIRDSELDEIESLVNKYSDYFKNL